MNQREINPRKDYATNETTNKRCYSKHQIQSLGFCESRRREYIFIVNTHSIATNYQKCYLAAMEMPKLFLPQIDRIISYFMTCTLFSLTNFENSPIINIVPSGR